MCRRVTFLGISESANPYICLGTRAQRSRLPSPAEMRSEQVACVVTSQNTDGPGAPQSAHGRELGLKTLGERKKKKVMGAEQQMKVPADPRLAGTGRNCSHHSSTNNKKREESEARG